MEFQIEHCEQSLRVSAKSVERTSEVAKESTGLRAAAGQCLCAGNENTAVEGVVDV